MLNVPCAVGEPLIVFVLVAKESPVGRDDVATEKVTACVDEAVKLYEKGNPVVAVAESELVISGNRHSGAGLYVS